MKIIRVYPSDEILNEYPQEKLNRNVYAYKKNGDLAWVIQEAPAGGKNRDKAYMQLRIENSKLVAGNWIGIDYYVNLHDGSVTPQNINTRPW